MGAQGQDSCKNPGPARPYARERQALFHCAGRLKMAIRRPWWGMVETNSQP